MGVFDKYTSRLEDLDPIKFTGVVEKVQGLLVESLGPAAQVGELCQILVPRGRGVVWAEVVGLRGKTVQLMPYDEMEGIEIGNMVIGMGEVAPRAGLGEASWQDPGLHGQAHRREGRHRLRGMVLRPSTPPGRPEKAPHPGDHHHRDPLHRRSSHRGQGTAHGDLRGERHRQVHASWA